MQQRLRDAGIDGVPVQVDNQSKYAALVIGHIDLIAQSGASITNPCTWDYAPGVLLAQEFGAEVNDAADQPFDFDTGPYLLHNRGVRCAHPTLYDSCFRLS
jgi:3'-phosphoadenosine 5'-phosphosulfate (PAPS) 3'-phosphatase